MTAIAESIPAAAATEASVTATPTHMDPKMLTIAANVRKEVKIDPEFQASVTELGVLEPIAIEATENGYHVLRGQRRTLAAIQAGHALVPVYLTDAQTEADRITTQLAENLHRSAMTDSDIADGYEQLSLLGISAAEIATRVSKPKPAIAAALKAKADKTSAEALVKGLTISQSVALAEFGDDPDLVAELETVALKSPASFTHKTQEARDERARAAKLETAKAEVATKGITLVESDPAAYYYSGPQAVVTQLTKADGSPVPEDYADAAYVGLNYNDEPFVRYVVTDWKARGLRKAGKGGGMTDTEKAERKELIANNRSMDSAIVVRKAWVAELLARKTAPKGANTFIAASLANHSYLVSKGISNSLSVAGEFLGGKEGEDGVFAKIAARPTKADTVILAAVLAGFEGDMSRTSWQNRQRAHQHYLKQLITWGYTPSDVEKIIIGN
jgi:ParB family chromosome partitioning protein